MHKHRQYFDRTDVHSNNKYLKRLQACAKADFYIKDYLFTYEYKHTYTV